MQGKFRILIENARKSWVRRKPRPLVCPELRLLYYNVPKAASSTVRRYLIEHGYPERRPDELNHHTIQHFEWPRATADEAEQLIAEGYRTFAVVRNPYDRLVSCYLDKIVGAGVSPGPSAGFVRYNRLLGRSVFRNDMSFLEFARVVSRIPDFAADAHIRCQRTFVPIGHGCVKLDRVIHMESFATEFADFVSSIGLPAWEAQRENVTKRSGRLLADHPEAVELIRKRYASCFRLFKYSVEDVPDV